MYVRVNIALLMHTNPQKARSWADLGDFEELALENMYLGCVTALPMCYLAIHLIVWYSSGSCTEINCRTSAGVLDVAIPSLKKRSSWA
jgi:hypothetical protein